MDQSRLDMSSLPARLYRVQYPDTQTSYSSTTGLQAKDTSTFYPENAQDAFRESIVHQFTWGWRQPTPYIALFSDGKHAENWACSYTKRTGDICQVLTIDTRELRDVYVFKLSELTARLDFNIPEGASQHVEGAYLCLHRIPNNAIIGCRTTRDIENEREDSKYREVYNPFDDDSSDDCEEKNLNDNIIKMIEGDW